MNIEVSCEVPAAWDEYVEGHPDVTAYHRSEAVLVARNAFGLDTFFLTARSPDGKLTGVLPLVEQSSFVFGRFVTSLPFVTYGGILADCSEVAHALARSAAALAKDRKAQHVEFRHQSPRLEPEFPARTDKVSMLLSLPDDVDELEKNLGSKLRSQIRRAKREEPEVLWGRGELLADFYSVFAPSMHGLGTPVYPRSFFDVVVRAMKDAAVIVIRVKGKPEAAAITVPHGRQIEVPWAAASLWGKRNAINMRMYSEMLKAAVNSGADAFDFGRSTLDSGTHKFKAQWGSEPQQLYWHYWLPPDADIPTLNHSNPKFDLAIRAWQKMPLWCANKLGPQISRYLP